LDLAAEGAMKSLRSLYHLARADFLQRTRSYGFLITLVVTLYVAYFFVPPNHSSYATMQIAGHRGLYNSAYLGSLMALLIAPFLSLGGFYLVKNAIGRDIQTGVGQILAATTLSKPLYTIGKTISNFTVLAAMVGIMGIAAGVMQFVRHEDLALNIPQLLAPLVFIALPVMTVVGAVAVLFEAVPWLRGGFGNVVYFFLWIVAMSLRLGRTDDPHFASNDLFGMGIVVPSISAACEAAFPGSTTTGRFSMGINFKSGGKFWDLDTFRWEGLQWTGEIIFSRLQWVALSLGLALLAALFFRRFDTAKERSKRSGKPGKEIVQLEAAPIAIPEAQVRAPVALHPISKRRRFSFLFMVVAELRLALHGITLWWYLVAAGLFAACLFTPLPISRGFLVAAWIWPLLIWSAMGTRERRLRTDQIVFSTARPLRRQLPACWLAGVIIAVATGGGTGLRLLLAGDQLGLLAWTAGALFIPTMALALGVWSGSSKLFEVLYLFLWYLGPANHLGDIDFMGAMGPLLPPRTPIIFLMVTAVLAVVAVTGRRRQLTN
jgi:hypothetical protein